MYHQLQPETIQEMFATIAKRYDRANAVLSFGLYRSWNQALVEAIGNPSSLLDLCAGTGDIALAFLKKNPRAQATLLDFCPEMLEIAKQKARAQKRTCATVVADAQHIPLPQESVEAVTVAYGIRNVKNPLLAFRECYRVLKPGGVFGILELTRPSHPLLAWGHHLYLHTLLPLLGKWSGKNKGAYAYLARSISTFSSPEEIKHDLLKAGFKKITLTRLTFGSATVCLARKP